MERQRSIQTMALIGSSADTMDETARYNESSLQRVDDPGDPSSGEDNALFYHQTLHFSSLLYNALTIGIDSSNSLGEGPLDR